MVVESIQETHDRHDAQPSWEGGRAPREVGKTAIQLKKGQSTRQYNALYRALFKEHTIVRYPIIMHIDKQNHMDW